MADAPDPMALALAQARIAVTHNEVPIGAIVRTATGQILAQAHNRTECDHDPTAHAEILALRQAARTRGEPRLPDCDVFVTLEPCPMCAHAISLFRVRRLVFGAYDPKGGGVIHGPRIFEAASCHHQPEVIGGVQETACAALLQRFFQSKR
jgi:tRNA(adenine34) deaminase